MTDPIAAAVERYVAVWNVRNREAREIAISEVFASDATYTDPLVDVKGHPGIAAVIAGVQSQFPGLVFKLLSGVDTHHRIARFSWELTRAGSEDSAAMGQEIATFDDDGKVRSVYAFLDKIPNLES